MSKVKYFTLNGWPKHVTEDELKPYWVRRTELSVESDCVMWGFRVVIPPVLRPQMLKELHDNHLGIVRMKVRARSHFWWPKLDRDIENLMATCAHCQLTRNSPPIAPVHAWTGAGRP